jgi:hypothetical protein
MSIEQVQSAIQALPLKDRRHLARWFDEHRHEFLSSPGGSCDEDVESAQQREVLSRLAETEADPDSMERFEEQDFDQMIQEFARARAKKPSTGQG